MNFDFTNTITRSDELKIEYGIIYGNNKVVIIKAGAGGSYMGYEDKYRKLAGILHHDMGCTVICLSNFSANSFESGDVDVIKGVVSEIEGEIRMYYIGVSNGAVQGLIDATKHFEFLRIMLFNMPLMINFHKTREALTRVNSDIRFGYGEMDPSHAYVPFLKNAAQKDTCMARVEVITVPQADHNFMGMLDTFLDLGKNVLNP